MRLISFIHRLLGVLFVCAPLHAVESRYPSGLLRYFSETRAPHHRQGEEFAVEGFLQHYFEVLPSGCAFRLLRRHEDGTHAHLLFNLFCEERRALNQYLKVHYNRQGYVEYATSHYKTPFVIDTQPGRGRVVEDFLNQWKQMHLTREGAFPGKAEVEKVFWIDEGSGRAIPATELRLDLYEPQSFEDVVLSEQTGEVLERRPVVRHAVTSRGWTVSPYNPQAKDNSTPIGNVSLSGIDDNPTKLRSSFFRVLRQENPSSPAVKDVDPSGVTGDPSADTPSNYKYDCTSEETCKEHRFNAVNIYYHVSTFRDYVQGALSALGASSPTSSTDPLLIVVNNFSVDFDLDGDSDEANNAGYVPRACVSSSENLGNRCLSFVKPTLIRCNGNVVQAFNLAREAMVIVHEYQHYLTDSITGLVKSGYEKPNVGDALHEGYSDYFAASHVTALAGRDVTIIGEYAFQQCTMLIRDVATLRVYENTEEDQDPHLSGLTWASGLWRLRAEYGQQVADKIALKSLYFLSPRPGFYEAVEALVKADKALYNGEHVARIRTLFFDELKFGGATTEYFRDIDDGIIEVGFRSCSSVAMDTGFKGAFANLSTFFLWFLGIFSAGVRLRRRR